MVDGAVQTVLAFDFGLRSIGVAIGHTLTGSARGIGVVQRRSGVVQWDKIDHLVAHWGCTLVGLSLHMDGSPQSFHTTKALFSTLESRYSLPFGRMSAYQRLRRVIICLLRVVKALSKENMNAESARIILEQWLRVCSPSRRINMQHCISIQHLTDSDIWSIMRLAQSYQQDSIAETMAGVPVTHLFYESSTRTAMSFQLSAAQLGADNRDSA